MNDPRDELVLYLDRLLDGVAWADTGAEAAKHVAEVLGWRPPARVIENQAQLSGWPIGTVIRDAQDGVARRTRMGDGPAWIALGVAAGSYRPVALPAVVLWTPEEAQR